MPTLLTAQQAPRPTSARPAPRTADRPVWPDEGPRTWAPRPTERAITANDLRTRLYQIADDSMKGRRIGEPGNAKVTAYIAREFERLGLRPAGDAGGWFQVLPYGQLGFDRATIAASAGGAPLAIGAELVPTAPSAANGFAARVALRGARTVFAGKWGDTSVTLDPAVFRGAVAVFTSDAAAGGTAVSRAPASFVSCADVPNKFGAAAAAAVEAAQRANPQPARAMVPPAQPPRDRRAQGAGAVGVLIVGLDGMSETARAGALTPRAMMQPGAIPGTDATVAGAQVSRAAAERILGRGLDGLAVGTTGGEVDLAWTYEWRPSAAPARNVVAILPGSDPALAKEYVLVGAHNDHVGTTGAPVDHDSLRAVNTVTRRQGANDPACQPTAEQQRRIDSLIAHARRIRPARLDSIFNGADDDGSGTAVLLEIAERFAAERPARSIIFISHQGEEAGLLGSRWFVEHPTVKLEDIVAAHNMDMLGKGRADQVKFGGPNSVQMLGSRRLSREFGDIIDSVNAVSPEPMAIDRSWDVTANPMNRFCRSDQVNYVSKNIPVTYFSLGYAQDYHQLTDEPQYISYDHSARLARFIHDVMWAIAQRPDRPAIAGPDPTYPSCGR
ncbi:MAG: M28 family peptidase [Gemmatimonadaceae bacterium]|nr:M28 family peptidase [Gemmatimonadaceae bacterium]